MSTEINSNGVFFASLTMAEEQSVNALEAYFSSVLRENKGNIQALRELIKSLTQKIRQWFEKDEVMVRIYTYLCNQTERYIAASC